MPTRALFGKISILVDTVEIVCVAFFLVALDGLVICPQCTPPFSQLSLKIDTLPPAAIKMP